MLDKAILYAKGVPRNVPKPRQQLPSIYASAAQKPKGALALKASMEKGRHQGGRKKKNPIPGWIPHNDKTPKSESHGGVP